MWVLILFLIGLIVGISFIESPGWFWRMLFWIEMRLPKQIDEL
jgi:hypothetical protein